MTSQITTYSGNINASFPVAGQDNDSQGFRDNFSSIQAAFTEASAEITALQTNGIFSATITGTPTPIVNNFQKSVISNAGFKQLNGIFYGPNTSASGIVNVDLNNGPMQKFVVSGNITLNFENWPTDSTNNATYGTVRVMLIGDQLNSYTVNFSTANSGTIKTATGFTAPTISANGKYEVVEAWSVDGGAHVFLKNVGEF
jgi:hypothetical protein